MVGRIGQWVGGSLLVGTLAVASSGSAMPQNRAPVAPPAPPECVCAPATAATVFSELDDELSGLDFDVADLESGEIAEAIAGQEAQDFHDRHSFQVFSSSSPWLGIHTEEVTSAKAKELNLPAERGVLVASVTEDSPAAKAGLKAGDVITEFDGQRVEGALTLQRLVRETPVGRKVSFSIWRDGRAQSLTVEIGSRRAFRSHDGNAFFMGNPDMNIQIPSIPAIAPLPNIAIGSLPGLRLFGAPALGIDAEDLSGQLGNYFGAPDGEGVLVREVMPGLPAEKAGLKAGDVIIRVDGKRVKDASELRAALRDKLSKAAEGADPEKSPAPAVDLTIIRSGKESVVRVEMESPRLRVRPLTPHVAV